MTMQHDTPLTIAILAGTIRPHRQSMKAARYVETVARELEGVEIVFVDPREFHFPEDGDELAYRDPRYSEITEKADAFFIVMPEYNHAYPGSLKRMLDSEYFNYHRKPVAVAGVSNGDLGGARGVENLLPVLRSLRTLAIAQSVYFARVDDLFDEHGTMDAVQELGYRKGVMGALKELVWTARALKVAREARTEQGG